MQLNRTPLYQQIVELLRTELKEGVHPSGARFPSERDLAERFTISRTTANKVLSVLVADGTLQHRKGVGAFVQGPPLQHDMSAMLSFTEKAKRAGFAPFTKVCEFARISHVELGEAIHLVRLRMVDGTPVILENRWLSAEHCKALTEEMAAGSLYAVLSDSLHLVVGHAEQRARAVVPTSEERKIFGLRAGSACLRVEGHGYLTDGTLLWVEDTLFRGDFFDIHGTLRPDGSGFHTGFGGQASEPRRKG